MTQQILKVTKARAHINTGEKVHSKPERTSSDKTKELEM